MSASQTSKCMNSDSLEYSEHEPDQITVWNGKVFNPNSDYTFNII